MLEGLLVGANETRVQIKRAVPSRLKPELGRTDDSQRQQNIIHKSKGRTFNNEQIKKTSPSMLSGTTVKHGWHVVPCWN